MPTLHIYIRIIIDTTRPEPNPPRQNQRPRHHALTPTIADSAAKNNRAEQGEKCSATAEEGGSAWKWDTPGGRDGTGVS